MPNKAGSACFSGRTHCHKTGQGQGAYCSSDHEPSSTEQALQDKWGLRQYNREVSLHTHTILTFVSWRVLQVTEGDIWRKGSLDGFLVLPGMAVLTLLTNWVSCAAQILKQEARHVCAWRAMK